MTDREQRRILYVMALALAVLVFSIGLAIQSIFSGLLYTFAISLACIICGAIIDDYNTRDQKTGIKKHHLRKEKTISAISKYRMGLGTSDSSGAEGPMQPVDVMADISSSTKPHPSGSQTRNLLDIAVNKYVEGFASESQTIAKEAVRIAPEDPVAWATLAAIHIARNECEAALIAKQQSMSIERKTPAAILADALYEYACLDSELHEVIEIPSNKTPTILGSYEVPFSSKIWWDEGSRQLKKGDLRLALKMYCAALIEHQHFPQAWEGVAIVYGLLEDQRAENAALIGKELAENEEDIPQDIWKSIGMVPRSQRLILLNLYRIVYGSRFRLPVFKWMSQEWADFP